ncbi:MAG: DUF3800 domain-containing protein [Stellaceae bacterium]
MPPIGYIAHIDEAGDDGLQRIKPLDQPGASEWLVIAAVVVKASRGHELVGWVRDIIGELAQPQLTRLHFSQLRPDKKELVCRKLASLPARYFVVISNKRNMKGHRNLAAEQARVNRTAWFYCWMLRLLLERVTDYCARRSFRDFGEHRVVRCELSDRGGVNMEDVRAYFGYLRDQSGMGLLFNDSYDLSWSVVDVNQLVTFPNAMRAGLQLADGVASAFYAGLERPSNGATVPHLAKLLLPRMCRNVKNRCYGYGIKVMPSGILIELPPDQKDLIGFYVSR